MPGPWPRRCYPLRLAHHYWKTTGDTSVFDGEWISAMRNILKTLREQQMKEGQYPPYKASGMAYISFARRQPQLFKVLFMRDRTGEPQPAEDELTRRIIGLIMKNTGLEEQAAYTLHIELWIFIHGIASMLVTGYLNLEETVISTMVTDVYQGLLARKKEETA